MINSNFMSRFTQYEILHPWLRSHTLYITICFLISGYCLYSQAIYHFAIAINRVWVSFFLMKNGKTKIGKLGNRLIWILPIFPLLLVSPRFAGTMVYLDLGPGVIFAFYNETWVKSYQSIAGPTIVLSSSFFSFILTLITIARYRHLLKQIGHNGIAIQREMYLLGHATVTLFFELLVGGYYGTVIFANSYNLPNLLLLANRSADYVIDLSCLVNPIALLIICKFVRVDFQEFWLKVFGKTTKVVNISSSSGNHRLSLPP
uniref:Serpentine receptor class gamma n=1 Tax=Panagrolaimus davidi TaxID=227884 RepID=A0A914P6W8_9BILA